MTRDGAIEKIKAILAEATEDEDAVCYVTSDDADVLDMAIKALEFEQMWIPVTERLPKDGQRVLFCDIDNDIMIGHHVKGRPVTHFTQDGTYEDVKNVIAWMPLPEPYKAESDDNA